MKGTITKIRFLIKFFFEHLSHCLADSTIVATKISLLGLTGLRDSCKLTPVPGMTTIGISQKSNLGNREKDLEGGQSVPFIFHCMSCN